MGIVRAYTEAEIGRILKQSERTPNRNGLNGHAESRHSLVAAGRGRAATSEDELEARIVDLRETRQAGAFSGEGQQAHATALALNSGAGQTALQMLNSESASRVVARICLRDAGDMIDFSAETTELPGNPYGPGNLMQVVVGAARLQRQVAGVCIVMERQASTRELHITTVYPLAELATSAARVEYTNGEAQTALPLD